MIAVSCLFAASSANAALEVAAHKVNTSAKLAHTAANAWALETDPSEDTATGAPVDPSFYATSGEFNNTYDTSQFFLETDSIGDYALGASVKGVGDYQVTSFDVLFKGLDSEDNYNSGYPYIHVYQDIPGHSAFQIVDNGIGDSPNLSDPLGAVDHIMFNLVASDDPSTYPSITSDPFFFTLVLGSYSDNPTMTPGMNMVTVDDTSFLNIGDPGGDTINTPYDPTAYFGAPTIDGSDAVPEPAGASLLAIGAAGILARRRSR